MTVSTVVVEAERKRLKFNAAESRQARGGQGILIKKSFYSRNNPVLNKERDLVISKRKKLEYYWKRGTNLIRNK